MNPFEYVNSILGNKNNLMESELDEKSYSPFLTNRALSYHKDSIFYAQEMNLNPHLDKKLQFVYLINTIKSMKRKSYKWSKKQETAEISLLMEYFGYNYLKAKGAASVLTKEQIKQIKKMLEKGEKGE
jgi:hypothetical protein